MSVVEIHLPNGWCTSVRTSATTSVQNLLEVVAKKFCGRGVDGSDSKHLSACFLLNGKTQWLQKSDLISKYFPKENVSNEQPSIRLKLDVHVRFFPVNLSDLSQQVLRLLFEQVFKVYINLNEKGNGEVSSQPDTVLLLELGCLQMRRVLGDCPPEAVYSKANMRYLEKQVGFNQFFPQVLLSRYSPAKLSFRRLIRNNLRQFSSLTADECTLRFLELLNKNYVFTDETFGHLTLGSSSSENGDHSSIQRIITLRIGPSLGLACVRSTGSICELAPFNQLESAEITVLSAGKNDSRPLLKIKTLDGDSLTLSCRDTSQASAIVSLLDGYTRYFCNDRSLLLLTSKEGNEGGASKSDEGSASSGISSNTALEDEEVTFEVVPFKVPAHVRARQFNSPSHSNAVSSGFATIRKHPKTSNGIGSNGNTISAVNQNLGRSRSNTDLRPRLTVVSTDKSNAQTQTISQNTQTENGSVVSEINGESYSTNNDDTLYKTRNAATAAWLARDRTPDSTPPKISFSGPDSPVISNRVDHMTAPSYATIRRTPSTSANSTSTNPTVTSAINRTNAVGWKHSSPVDDYIELFEPDVEIDRSKLDIGVLIGEGQFGDVFEGEYRPGGKEHVIAVAVKMCKSGSDEALGDFLEEACLFRQLAHPYIIALVGVSTSTDPLLILTELAPLGPLRDFLTKEKENLKLNVVDLLTFSAQTASALAYLHSRRLVHRDIAARNVLVFSRELGKLADFGLARRLPPDADTYTATGGRLPVKWLAPESVNFRKFSRATDVWMLGVFLWEVTTFGSRPWQNVRNADYPTLLSVGARLPRPEPTAVGAGNVVSCPQSLYSLMLACWADQPYNRPGCDQIFSELLTIREAEINIRKAQLLPVPMPPPKPPISEPQQPQAKSSSNSLALEQATLWLLDSVATLAPTESSLSPTLNSTTSTTISTAKIPNGFAALKSSSQTHLGFVDSRPSFSALAGSRRNDHTLPRAPPPFPTQSNQKASSMTMGKPFVVPIIKTLTPSTSNGDNATLSPTGGFSDAELNGGNQLYNMTLNVVRCVFTLNKELERVSSDSPPACHQILDLASAVCSGGRNLLTAASSVQNGHPSQKNPSEPASVALLRANLGAHIRSVLAALRPLTALPPSQQLLPPPVVLCRQLAEAAAGVAVASRLLLSRTISPENGSSSLPFEILKGDNPENKLLSNC